VPDAPNSTTNVLIYDGAMSRLLTTSTSARKTAAADSLFVALSTLPLAFLT
jgi:hypothetical protein